MSRRNFVKTAAYTALLTTTLIALPGCEKDKYKAITESPAERAIRIEKENEIELQDKYAEIKLTKMLQDTTNLNGIAPQSTEEEVIINGKQIHMEVMMGDSICGPSRNTYGKVIITTGADGKAKEIIRIGNIGIDKANCP